MFSYSQSRFEVRLDTTLEGAQASAGGPLYPRWVVLRRPVPPSIPLVRPAPVCPKVRPVIAATKMTSVLLQVLYLQNVENTPKIS